MTLLTQNPQDPRFLSQYAGGDATPTGMGNIQGTMTQPQTQTQPQTNVTQPPTGLFGANPPAGAQFTFQNYLQTAVDRLNANNDLVAQKNLLIKQLYDAPLTPDQLQKLPQPLQQAIASGNKPDMEMQLRLLNDQIAGRTNTMNQSISFLADGYSKSVQDAEKQRQDAVDTVLKFSAQYGSRAGKALESLYGPEYVQKLKDQGIDIEKFSQMSPSTISELKIKPVGSGGAGAAGLSSDALDLAATTYLLTGAMPAFGSGGSAQRIAILNRASEIEGDPSQLAIAKATYGAASSAVKNRTEQISKMETSAANLQAQFDRLAQLADAVNVSGSKDINSIVAKIKQKFGSTVAAQYEELLTTVQNDYANMQAAVAGSKGAEYFSRAADQAIPAGLTASQYRAIYDTLLKSSENARSAMETEVQDLLSKATSQYSGTQATEPDTMTVGGVTYKKAADGKYYPQ